jgi:hypothetical protein
MLENLQDIEDSVKNIAEYLVNELMTGQAPYYKFILVQGICMCLWYSTPHTLKALKTYQYTDRFFDKVFSLAKNTVKYDVEIKRFVIGLSSVLQCDPRELSPQVQKGIMKVIVSLCKRSINVRNENLKLIE